jgi:quinoprotein glucose dehydrogenase
VIQTHAAVINKLIPRAEAESLNEKDFVFPNEFYEMKGAPYAVHRQLLSSQFGAPCNPPPWGSVTAVDLVSGEVRWKRGLGTLRHVAPFPVSLIFRGEYGSPSFGGGLSTDSGLYFVGASMDRGFRAFDVETGEELWMDELPFAGNAVPMTYRLTKEGRQFVVIAAGANPISEMGDALVAYALPEKK